jgi:hypothetical protein
VTIFSSSGHAKGKKKIFPTQRIQSHLTRTG